MKKELHLKQAKHNSDFAAHCETTFADNYFDWKITVVFYEALHYVKAYLEIQGVTTDTLRHTQISDIIDYDPKRNRGAKQKIPFVKRAFKSYQRLRENSENARYDCHFLNQDDGLAHNKSVYNQSKQALGILKDYLEARGLFEPTKTK